MKKAFVLTFLSMIFFVSAGSRPKARQHYEKGLESLRGDDFKHAAKEFRKAAKEDPSWADAHFQLAMAYLALGKFKDAEKSNRRALELAPELADAQYWAQFFVDRRLLSKALGYAERGRFDLAAGEVARFLDTGGDLDRLNEVFRNSWVAASPVVKELAAALAKQAQWGRLEETVLAWGSISPEEAGVVFGAAVAAMSEAGEFDRGLELTGFWLERVPDSTVDALTHQGLLLVRKGDEEGARAIYEQLLRTLQSQLNLICHQPAREFIEHFGGEYQEVEPTVRTVPRFTSAALGSGVRGSLTIRAVVGLDGLLHGAEVLPPGLGYGLDENALGEIRNWRFKPASINGVPIRRRVTIEVSFGSN